MIHKLKILIQILLINFLILFLFSFNFAHSKNDICNYFSEESLNLNFQNYPNLIEIETPNAKKWFLRTLKAVGGIELINFIRNTKKQNLR